MNKNAIQKFAIWARNELIAQVSQRAYQYGIDESGFGDASADTLNGRLLTAEEKSQRQELIGRIKEKGYQQVMEEVAYTWFNRFIALRFMEVNNYLPSHIRVFSDASGAFKPEILNDVLHLDLPGLDSGKVAEYIESNGTEALYRYLLLTQCNALNSALPVMFERMGGYTEMLLPNNILRQDSVLGHMVSDIPEEDWQDAVQIIGWLYQYYNTELKDDTFAQLKKNVKITKERIPAATQLFTPDWIVRYMVENSLGRLWLEGHPNAELRGGWKYYLDEAKQGPEVETQLTKLREEYKTIKPEEIKVIDPCMGSGHILVYAFDVLMQIYTSAGWDQREAAQSILKNNLYGLDIDDRAAQLAYFAVMMKARQYDRRLLTRGIQPNVYSIRESIGINRNQLKFFGWSMSEVERNTALTQLEYLLDTFRDAKEYGSILNVDMLDWGLLYRFVGTVDYSDQISMDELNLEDTKDALWNLVELGAVLAQKYDVVCTNPPYMGIANLGGMLYDYIQAQFDAFKQDLYCVFVEKCRKLLKKNGIQSLITQQSFMFNSRFENMREALINASAFVNMIYLGTKAFDEISGEKVRTCAYVIQNIRLPEYISYYIDLQEQESELSKEQAFLSIANVRNVSNCNRYTAKLMDFEKLDGKTFSFWISSADYSEDENIPLWNMYSGDKYGVRIQFVIPRSSFSFHSIIIDTTRYAKAYRHGADCINFYLMNINDAKMPYPNVWIHTSTKPIVYKNDLAISSYQLPANNLYNLSTVASVKADSWAFQHEVRIVADFQYSASAFEEKQPIVELPDFEYILIPISFSRLEKITITFSPWMQEQTKRMVSESIEKLELNCECTVQSSRFDKLIRRK